MHGLMIPQWKERFVENRRAYWVYLFARLKPSVTIEQAHTAINVPYHAIVNDVEVSLQENISDQTMARFKAKEIEVDWISDREAVIRFKNCDILRRSRELVEKAGLDVDPKFFCEMDKYRHAHPRHPMDEIGLELTCELEENGCKWTFKLP